MSVAVREANLHDQLPIAATPEQLDVWLGPDSVPEVPLFGRNGDPLPTVSSSIAKFLWHKRQAKEEAVPILRPLVLETTVVSEITGCWLASPERYRTHGGYVPDRDKDAAVSQSASSTRHRANWQRVHVPKGEKPLSPEDTWEHYCGTPGCSEPDGHGKMMPIEENIDRKEKGKTFDLKLREGQPMLTVAGMEWLEPLVNEAGEGLVDAIIVNKIGAYILEVKNGAIHSHFLRDPAREAMRAAAPYPHRKEKIEINEWQLSLDVTEMYHDLLRRAIAKRRQQAPLLPIAA